MKSSERFTNECAAALKKIIKDAGGNEVFVLGFCGESGLIESVEVKARGNEDSVPAIFDLLHCLDPMPDVLIHNHPPYKARSKNDTYIETVESLLTPSDNDMIIASRGSDTGLGSYIVDNSVQNVYVIVEPVLNKKTVKLNSNKIIAQLQAGGNIAKRLNHFETRNEQLDLMALIIRGFNEDANVAAEAGTGVGKSFAYLLPAIGFALANEERIIISTATITLQQQLFEKDIPLVVSALNKKIKAVLVKGRSNYLCRRRLSEAQKEKQLFSNETETAAIDAISSWAESSSSGDKSDLTFMPPAVVWQSVCGESDLCKGMSCLVREKCFVMALRRRAQAANILVVNHHLLFADISARSQGAGYDSAVVLPPYRRVIIDEAHNIEKSATSFFTAKMSRLGLLRSIGRLYRERGTMKSGSLAVLINRLPIFNGADNLVEYSNAIKKIHDAIDGLNSKALELCGNEGVFRLINGRQELINDRLLPFFEDLRSSLLRFVRLAENAIDTIEEQDKVLSKNEQKEDDNLWEVRNGLRQIKNAALLCATFIEWQDHPSQVLWIERNKSFSKEHRERADYAAFNCAPISIAEVLQESLFEVNKTVICVSATLTVSNTFDFFSSRTGIELAKNKDGKDKMLLKGKFPSPFPYGTAVLTASPRRFPMPTDAQYQDCLQDAVFRLTETSGGSALVLFTSFDSLHKTYKYCADKLASIGLRCLKQGDDDRHRLLQDFLDDHSSILFATDSFWEGVDAPGDTLRMLIICRLPFIIPNDPVFQARCEQIEKDGGNSFMDLSLPASVMKFRQGFGRLMRRNSDRGVVAILDNRVLTKSYGEVFLRSIPKTKTCFADLPTILRESERVLFGSS
ncbi:MAG: ATP-dependent DNA helicase [Termitinemataceae bacterium]|nr:MAG: ATP-dependent DNA helicase [Termitinemataceae bacterium]